MNYINADNFNQVDHLVLASASEIKLARWKQGLNGFANLYHVDSLIALQDELARIKPDVLLLDHDLPGLDGVNGIHGLRNLSPETKIVMLKGSASDDEEWTMFKACVRGCCPDDIDPSVIITLVDTVQKGELWIRRTLTHRLLEELEEKQTRNHLVVESSLSLLQNLTHREYEIAVRIKKGHSNKEIAHALDISERTVKAHMTTIFRKLSVTDRLKVALILSEDKRQEWRDTHKNKA